MSDEEKSELYADLRPGETVKALCRRHKISSSVIYEWLKKAKKEALCIDHPLQPLHVTQPMESFFATITIGTKQISISQYVSASYLNELK
jgi:transposase-like protein